MPQSHAKLFVISWTIWQLRKHGSFSLKWPTRPQAPNICTRWTSMSNGALIWLQLQPLGNRRFHAPDWSFVSRERIALHAYSGRRRHGDFQWYLDAIGKQGRLEGLFVVSLDLVIDSQWGDIENKKTQHFWLNALPSGYIVAMLSGSPCCTWSSARGKQYEHTKIGCRGGPRVLRDLSALWGYHSVSLREKRQLYDGHLLLGFSIHAMVLLSTVGGTGALEHPSNLRIPMQQAFWRLPLMQLVMRLPGFQHIELAQGLLGADSTKRTGLLTLNLPDLPLFIRTNAACPHLPSTPHNRDRCTGPVPHCEIWRSIHQHFVKLLLRDFSPVYLLPMRRRRRPPFLFRSSPDVHRWRAPPWTHPSELTMQVREAAGKDPNLASILPQRDSFREQSVKKICIKKNNNINI